MGGVLASIVFKNGNERIQISTQNESKSIWDIPLIDINNNNVTLRKLVAGKKVILFVNLATKWGLVPRDYTALVQMHQKYRDQGLEIIGFPCN